MNLIRLHFVALICLLLPSTPLWASDLPASGANGSALRTAAAFVRIRNNPSELYMFLLRMPKGADLHNHLAGAVYAENLIREAAASFLCIDQKHLAYQASAGGHCPVGQLQAGAAQTDNELASKLIDSLSMRDFVPGAQSGHDHFFDSFDKFGVVTHGHDGDAVAEVVKRAAEQNESYLELMALTGGKSVSALGKEVGFDGDFESARQKLEAAGLEARVKELQLHVDEMEADRVRLLECKDHEDSAPCRVAVRYVFQVLRDFPKEEVFAQVLSGFMLAKMDPRVVAVNFVQPEDYATAMDDYHLHMQMVDYAKHLFPNVHVTLHAGELALGQVPPEGLRFHIREAVRLGHAERIGHGVDIAYETQAADTLRIMREQHVDVEINLSSNAEILGVQGDEHPFQLYRKSGVPVTLSTDDEGVGRTHLTEEYRRAVQTYGLSYFALKEIVRNSLEFSFLPGASYWTSPSYRQPVAACADAPTSASCRGFLAQSDKAKLQADLEQRFAEFESQN